RLLSSVDSTPIASNRFLMVLVDSSAARMPLPGATIARATLLSSARFILRLPAEVTSAVPTNPVPTDSLPFITLKYNAQNPAGRPSAIPIQAIFFRQFLAAVQRFNTSTPGSGLPSIHSRKAPPAVET